MLKRIILFILLSLVVACGRDTQTNPPDNQNARFELFASITELNLARASSQHIELELKPKNGFSETAVLSIIGLPDGVNADFNATSIKEKSTLKLTADSKAQIGSSQLTLSARAADFEASLTLELTITEVPQGEFSIAFKTPATKVLTNGSIAIELALAGETPERVELLIDNEVVSSIEAPFKHQLDTANLSEGTHLMKARASSGKKLVETSIIELTVDRTVPGILSRTPEPNQQNVNINDAIVIVFSEPLIGVDSSTIELIEHVEDGLLLSPEFRLSEDKTVLSIKLTDDLSRQANAVFSLSLKNLTDLAGNLMPAETWSWEIPLWQQLDNSLNLDPGKTAFDPVVAVTRSQTPFISWYEYADADELNGNVYVKQWDGNAWQLLGNDALDINIGADASTPAMALDSQGNPVVAWEEEVALRNYNIYVKQWDGTKWIQLAHELDLNASNSATSAALAIDNQDRPIVAWEEKTDIIVKRWTGTSWQQLGSALDIDLANLSNRPAIALDGNTPVVTWQESSVKEGNTIPTNNIYVKRFDETSSSWQSLTSPANMALGLSEEPLTDFNSPGIVIDSKGSPLVTYVESSILTSRAVVRVKTLSQGTWVEQSTAPLNMKTEGGKAHNPVLAISKTDQLMLTWSENGFPFERAEGIALKSFQSPQIDWQAFGSRPLNIDPVKEAETPTVALDANGIAVVTWYEENPDAQDTYNIYVKRLNKLTPQ